jgi:hypothetical protein
MPDANDYLLKESDYDHAYFLAVEKLMFDHFNFFVVVLSGALAGTFAVVRLFMDMKEIPVATGILFSLSLVVAIVFVIGRQIYVELRIRKIQMLEQLAILRKEWGETLQGEERAKFDSKLILIKGIEKCPPYLRSGSAEWFTLIFFCFVIGTAGAAAVFFLMSWIWLGYLPDNQKSIFAAGYVGLAVGCLVGIALCLLSWHSTVLKTFFLDLKRQKRFGVLPAYDLVETRGEGLGLVGRLFDWLQRCHQCMNRDRLLKKLENGQAVTRATGQPAAVPPALPAASTTEAEGTSQPPVSPPSTTPPL